MRKEIIEKLKEYKKELKRRVKHVRSLKEYEEMLYIIDMINGFVYEGVLHDEHIALTIPEQKMLIKMMNDNGEGVAFVKEFHNKNCTEFKTFPEHGVKGTSEAALVPELREYEDDALVYLKNSTSAMFAPYMMKHLAKMKNLKVVIGVGCCTDICVMNFLIALKNYFNQLNRDIAIFVVKKATDTYHIDVVHDRNEYSEMAYKLMAQAGIIVVEDLEELVKVREEMGLVKRKVRR